MSSEIKRLKQFGYQVIRLSEYHYQIRNLGFIFNIYPNRRTVYINGMTAGMRYRGYTDLIEILNLRGIQAVRHKRKQNLTNHKVRMFNSNPICWLCNSKIEKFQEASVDHAIPLDKGGSNRGDNLRLAHKSCNFKKANHIIVGGSL